MAGSEHGPLRGNRQQNSARAEHTASLQESQVQKGMGFWLGPPSSTEKSATAIAASRNIARRLIYSLLPLQGGAIPCPLCYKGRNGSYGKVVCPVDESPRMYQTIEKVPAEPIDGPESGSERPKGGFRRLNGSQ